MFPTVGRGEKQPWMDGSNGMKTDRSHHLQTNPDCRIYGVDNLSLRGFNQQNTGLIDETHFIAENIQRMDESPRLKWGRQGITHASLHESS